MPTPPQPQPQSQPVPSAGTMQASASAPASTAAPVPTTSTPQKPTTSNAETGAAPAAIAGPSRPNTSAGAGASTSAARQPQTVAAVVAASVAARRERKRKRVHYSCAECHRRKSKCDRKTPCQPCIDRGIGDTCRPFEDGDEHGDARDRIQRLEDLVEGLGEAQAKLAQELTALQRAQQLTAGSLALTRRDFGQHPTMSSAGVDARGLLEAAGAMETEHSKRKGLAYAREILENGADAYSGYRLPPSLDTANGGATRFRSHLQPRNSLSSTAPAPLSLSNQFASPEDSSRDDSSYRVPNQAQSYAGSEMRHGHELDDDTDNHHQHGDGDDDGHPERGRRRDRARFRDVSGGPGDEDVSMAHRSHEDNDDDDDGEEDGEDGVDGGSSSRGTGRLTHNTKIEPAENFEGGLTVEGGMHGEANFYGALALPSVSRSVVRTEIRGEHLELHADLPRCPASVMLYRLIHEGGAPPDILQQLMADLPSKETCDTLVRLYFRDINWTRLPIHEASFRQSYDELMEFRSGRSLNESGETGGRYAAFLALLFVILATVKRSQPEEMGSEEDARTGSIKLLHGFKKTAAIAASIRIDHLDMLVAHLLAARWYIVNRHSAEAWAALGFAVRAAQALGMHRDGSKLGLDAVTTERRRRLFSLVQYLDSTTSILLGRPLGINPAHCDSQPPSDIDIDTMPRASRPHPAIIYREGVPPGLFAFIAIRHEMNRLTGRIVEHFQNLEKARQYSDVMSIDADLRKIRDTLPGPYRHTDADTSYDSICPWLPLHRYLLNIEIFYFRITLHRPYMLRSSDAKYDFSRRAAVDSAKADRLLRETYKRTVEWPSNRCRRTFMGGLYRLFNATLIFAVALLQDPKGPDAADFATHLDEFIERHRSADRTDAATRREVKIIELFRSKALDPTWCALTATGTTPHPSKALLAIHGPGNIRPSSSSGPRRSHSRSALNAANNVNLGSALPNPSMTSAPLGPSAAGGAEAVPSPSSDDHHRRASSATGGIHFGDERSVIHAAPASSSMASISVPYAVSGVAGGVISPGGGAGAGAGAGGSMGSYGAAFGQGAAPVQSQSATAALSHLRHGALQRAPVSEAGSAASGSGHSPANGAAAMSSHHRPSYVTAMSENGTGGINVPGSLVPPGSSSFTSLFGNGGVSGGSGSVARNTPGGLNGAGFWASALASGSGSGSTSTPAPNATNLGGPSAFDFSGGLSLGSFDGGSGGFGNMMGLGDADFAQSLFDQLGVSLDQFGLASGSGTVMGDGLFGGVGGTGGGTGLMGMDMGSTSTTQAVDGSVYDAASQQQQAGADLGPDSFNFDFGRAHMQAPPSQGGVHHTLTSSMAGTNHAGTASASAALPHQPVSTSTSFAEPGMSANRFSGGQGQTGNPSNAILAHPPGTVVGGSGSSSSDITNSNKDSNGNGNAPPTSGSEWAGVRAWGPLVEAIALATGGSHSGGGSSSAQGSVGGGPGQGPIESLPKGNGRGGRARD
ncbi:hypothetical protein CF336_g1701 [Tilletia laevis]|uniref:Uncharacterized protein n=3 Tax=Tilletia TaxID=13289 RepID=A0A177V5M2_9BASI|nr:hypothetical protein CF336_g1701 [Tilletia laevis]KAE8206283.1 hypothetical protein CF335_g2012 [Tilletia laevis]KAE8264023.1 hypothetical protein A4X03_0g1247 [Tilletia caries]